MQRPSETCSVEVLRGGDFWEGLGKSMEIENAASAGLFSFGSQRKEEVCIFRKGWANAQGPVPKAPLPSSVLKVPSGHAWSGMGDLVASSDCLQAIATQITLMKAQGSGKLLGTSLPLLSSPDPPLLHRA